MGLEVSVGLYRGIQKTAWAMVMRSLTLVMKHSILVLVL